MTNSLKRIRFWLAVFIVGLVLSGVTAFPLTWEVGLLVRWFGQGESGLATWLRTVHTGLVETDQHFPFLAYGTDWLAFAHLVIAVAFIGPWRDPVRNIWLIRREILRLDSGKGVAADIEPGPFNPPIG